MIKLAARRNAQKWPSATSAGAALVSGRIHSGAPAAGMGALDFGAGGNRNSRHDTNGLAATTMLTWLGKQANHQSSGRDGSERPKSEP